MHEEEKAGGIGLRLGRVVAIRRRYMLQTNRARLSDVHETSLTQHLPFSAPRAGRTDSPLVLSANSLAESKRGCLSRTFRSGARERCVDKLAALAELMKRRVQIAQILT